MAAGSLQSETELLGHIAGLDRPLLRVDDYSTTDVTYLGYASPGTSGSADHWLIAKVDETGNGTQFDFADGNTKFDNKWSDRTSLSYS